MDIPNGVLSPRSQTPEMNLTKSGYSTEGPKRKTRTASKLSVPEPNPVSPRRRRASAVVPPNPAELAKPVSNGFAKARRRSCPVISPRSILSNGRLRSPAIKIDSPRSDYDSQDNSPKTVWEEIDQTLDSSKMDIQREPLPGGSPEFRRCMTQIETLHISEEQPKIDRPRRLSSEWQPKIIRAKEPSSPRSPRKVRWLDVS